MEYSNNTEHMQKKYPDHNPTENDNQQDERQKNMAPLPLQVQSKSHTQEGKEQNQAYNNKLHVEKNNIKGLHRKVLR